MSPARGFGRQGRGAQVVTREAFRAAWARAQIAAYGVREVAAAAQGVTFQTACNWFDEFSTPTGDKVVQFALTHRALFDAMLDEVAA